MSKEEQIEALRKQVIELQGKINKAIDFLENHIVATETEETLLKILKGEENEVNKKE